METAIIILSILALFQFIENRVLSEKISKIKSICIQLESQVSDSTEFIAGGKVQFERRLEFSNSIIGKEKIHIVYEANIIETSLDKIKVTAYDFSPITVPTSVQNVPNYKRDIINAMKELWIEKKDVQPILNTSIIRNSKIDKILK